MKSSGKGLTTVLALTLVIVGVIDTGTVLAEGSRDARCGRVFAINGRNELLRLDVLLKTFGYGDDEGYDDIGIRSRKRIVGLTLGDVLVGIDFRPAGLGGRDQLYGIATIGGGTGPAQLYKIDTDTAVATPVGTGRPVLLPGTSFGFDFNPVSDRIRVVSDRGFNFRVDPNTGAFDILRPRV